MLEKAAYLSAAKLAQRRRSRAADGLDVGLVPIVALNRAGRSMIPKACLNAERVHPGEPSDDLHPRFGSPERTCSIVRSMEREEESWMHSRLWDGDSSVDTGCPPL